MLLRSRCRLPHQIHRAIRRRCRLFRRASLRGRAKPPPVAKHEASGPPAASKKRPSRSSQSQPLATPDGRPPGQKYLRQRSLHRLPHRSALQPPPRRSALRPPHVRHRPPPYLEKVMGVILRASDEDSRRTSTQNSSENFCPHPFVPSLNAILSTPLPAPALPSTPAARKPPSHPAPANTAQTPARPFPSISAGTLQSFPRSIPYTAILPDSTESDSPSPASAAPAIAPLSAHPPPHHSRRPASRTQTSNAPNFAVGSSGKPPSVPLAGISC